MRAIDADKLQKAIPAEEDNITGMGMTYDEMKAYNDGIDEQWKKIVNAPTIEPERKTEWIPCGERLPEYGCPVLWCNENGSVFVSAITVKTDHGWAIGKRHRMCEVIAWMPLPEPYQGEGDSNDR